MASAPFVIGGPGGDPDLNAILSVSEGTSLAKCMRRSFRAHEHASVCTLDCHGPVLHGLEGCACFVAGQEVVLDKATADQIKKASPPPKSFKIEEVAAFRRAHSISKEFCQPLNRSQVCRLSWIKSANITEMLDVYQPRSAKGCLICIPEVAAPAMLASHRTLHRDGTQCPRMQVRAALLAQALRLVNGSSAVRLQVVEALVEALNSNSLSLVGHIADAAVQQQIADALAGMCSSQRPMPQRIREAPPVC